MEIWKPIKNYENLYDASNYGRVRSLKYGKMRILKPSKKTDGYLRVVLYKDCIAKTFLVHRLIWETFNGKIPEGMEVNHINEDKADCSLDNLNLLTHKANSDWGTRNKRIGEKNINGKRSDPVLQLTYPGLEFMCEWPSVAEAGRNGFCESHVWACCLGKRKSHKGVTFRYKKSHSK